MNIKLWHGDCVERMSQVPDNSIAAVICDPPYEIGFMGKGWDSSGIAYSPDLWDNVFRILKPGGIVKAFSATRMYHRQATAMERAGFTEIRLEGWAFGSGFPKSLNVEKAINKMSGVTFKAEPASGVGFMNPEGRGGYNVTQNKLTQDGESVPDAEKWKGWGTALKPAWEPVVVGVKPVESP